jgi:hypothetical protein
MHRIDIPLTYFHSRSLQPPNGQLHIDPLHVALTMGQNNMWSETAPHVPLAVMFPWGLAGPVMVSRSAQRRLVIAYLSLSQDFDCDIADMTESPTDGDTVSNDTDPMSKKSLIVDAMARQPTNPSLVDSTVDSMARHIAPEHDADPFDFGGRTVVSSYVPLICVLLAGVA